MTSQYAYSIHKQRRELLEGLVSKLLGAEPGEENFGLALDFCLQKAYYHTFLDVHPPETEAFYVECVARLEADSQLSKAAALSALTSKLLALPLTSPHGVPDLNHNLLQLLASLANRPLSSTLDLSAPDVLELLYQPATQLKGAAGHQQQGQGGPQQQQGQSAGASHFQRLLLQAAAGACGGSDSDAASVASSGVEVDPYGDDSSLSDWDSSDGPQQHLQTALVEHEVVQQQQEGEQQEQELQVEPANVRQPAVQAAAVPRYGLQQPRPPLGVVLPGPQQPLSKLLAVRPGRMQLQQQWQQLPLRLAQQQQQQQRLVCFSEQFLAQQVLRVLQGLPAQGFVLQSAAAAEAENSSGALGSTNSSGGIDRLCSWEQFVVDPRISTPYLLPSVLQSLLSDVAAAGTCARQLRALVQQLSSSSSNGLVITPCLRALGAALQQQLDLLGLQLTGVQQQLTQQQAPRTTNTHGQDQRASSSNSRWCGSSVGQQQQVQERGVLLLLVKHQLRPVLRRLQLLHSTLFQQVLQRLAGPPAAVSAAVVDGLAAAVQAAGAHAASQQCVADASALLHLLLSCCVPLSRSLAQWLWSATDGAVEPRTAEGQQMDPADGIEGQSSSGVSVCSQDFFITRQARDIAAVHPSFWHTAYGFCQQESNDSSSTSGSDKARSAAPAGVAWAAGSSGGGGSSSAAAARGHSGHVRSPAPEVCCPAVLAPLAQRVMAAGKSMRLLDHLNQLDLQHSMFHNSSSTRPNPATAAGLPGPSASSWAAAAPQQQLQPGVASRSAGGALQRQTSMSTPRRRRPSTPGRAPPSTAAAAGGAGGRFSRQPSVAGDGVFRPAAAGGSSSEQLTRQPQTARGGRRKRWGDDGPAQQATLHTNAATAPLVAGSRGTSLRVRLQLATAAAVAGQHEQEELPDSFIATACYILQQEQQLHKQGMQQVRQQQQQAAAGNTCSGTADLLMRRLEAVAHSLAQPHSLVAGGLDGVAAAGADAAARSSGESLQQQQKAGEPLSLRSALAAARKARLAGAAALSGHAQPMDGAAGGGAAGLGSAAATATAGLQEAPAGDASHEEALTAGAAHSSVDADTLPSKQPVSPAAPASPVAAPATPPPADSSSAADAASRAAAQRGSGAQEGNSSSSGGGVLLPLLAHRDQLAAQLAAAGQQLQRMAPWDCEDDTATQADSSKGHKQEQGQKQDSKTAESTVAGPHSGGCSSWLLRAAATKVPGHFSSSLAELWPLQPVLGLRGATAGSSSSSTRGCSGWLRGAAWPSNELSWLLHDPPAHLPAVQQLLASALIQPVRTRVELVDRQLLSGLMGEWGMLVQLKGLVNVFLIASPSIVEWVDGLFDAVEATEGSSRGEEDPSTPTAASRTAARTAGRNNSSSSSRPSSAGSVAAPGADRERHWPVDVARLELVSLEELLHECVLSGGPDEILPHPDALLLTYNQTELAKKRRQVSEKQQQQAAQQGSGPAAAAAGASGSVPGSSSGADSSVEPDMLLHVSTTGGLLACNGEWVALQLQHAGSWQLSLVYNDEQLRVFTKVWRLMLQLRWVRRRVGAQVLSHRSSATVTNLLERDRQEAVQAAAAAIARSGAGSSRRGVSGAVSSAWQQQDRTRAATAAAGPMPWLSSKEELLLLQEMWHFLGCWQAFVLDGVCVKAWGTLEKALLSAQSLEQVHAAARAFLWRVCDLCNLVPPGGSTDRFKVATHTKLEELMDAALAAAAAAGRLQAVRQKLQKLQELQAMSGQPGTADKQWVELSSARTALWQARQQWSKGLHEILRNWRLMERSNYSHAFEELQGLLDMNGYFSRARA